MMDHTSLGYGFIICAFTVLVYNGSCSFNTCIDVSGQTNDHLLQPQQTFSFVSGCNTCNPRNSKNVSLISFHATNPNNIPYDSETISTPHPLLSQSDPMEKTIQDVLFLRKRSLQNNNNQFESQLKPKMTSIVANDALQAQVGGDLPKGVTVMPMGSFRVEKIGSLDEFKQKKLNFAALRPAVLLNENLVLGRLRSEL